jgi:hypothetical protein
MNLRERVEHRACRLVELNRTADFERAGEDLFGAFEVAKLHVDLTECGEGDREPVTRAERLVQSHAALGKRECLIVPMTHQRDVRLVVHDPGEHVISRNLHRETFTLPQTSGRFIDAPGLCEEHGGQRVHERQVTPIAGGMKRRGRLREMLANDARVADLLVAERELVVRETDRSGFVRQLRMFQGA